MGLAESLAVPQRAGPEEDRPPVVLVDELDLPAVEPGLLGELPPCRIPWRLTEFEPTLRQLPLTGVVFTFEGEEPTVVASYHGDDADPEMWLGHPR